MPPRKHTSKSVFELFQSLGPDEQEQFIRQMLGQEADDLLPDRTDKYWITIDAAAEAVGRHKSHISRLVGQGKLLSNGKKHKHFRVLHVDVIRLLIEECFADMEKTARRVSSRSPLSRRDKKFLALCKKWILCLQELRAHAALWRQRILRLLESPP